jgi:hypothetical protein
MVRWQQANRPSTACQNGSAHRVADAGGEENRPADTGKNAAEVAVVKGLQVIPVESLRQTGHPSKNEVNPF